MNVNQLVDGDERVVREYRYDDGVVLAADLGPSTAETDVNVLSDTAVVVTGSGEDAERVEIDLPEEDAQVFMKNGVLTIELEDES